jgi:hypothetical protein
MGVGGVGHDPATIGRPSSRAVDSRVITRAAAPSRDRRGIGGGDGAVLGEGGTQGRDLVGVGLAGLFVLADDVSVALAGLDRRPG